MGPRLSGPRQWSCVPVAGSAHWPWPPELPVSSQGRHVRAFVRFGHRAFHFKILVLRLVTVGCSNRCHRPGALTAGTHFSRFWRLQGQGQGVRTWQGCFCQLAVSSHSGESELWGREVPHRGPALVSSSKPGHHLKAPPPNTIPCGGTQTFGP